jgi:N-acyl-D-amino-acid deacylase
MRALSAWGWAVAIVGLAAADFDLVLRHGRVADGTGNPVYHADVAIREGRVAAVGHVAGAGAVEIDVRGLVVAPGFIDVHTHADELAEHPDAANFVRMGVTTLVAGNCGTSALDVAGFFAAVEKAGTAVNVATLIGHGSVRARAMGGSFDRVPTPEEWERMRALVARAIGDGAVGLSTGLIYPPGSFATTDELVELARVVAPHGGLYASHMRSEGRDIFRALDEVFRIAREAGVRAEVSHIKLSGPVSWGQAEAVLAAIERARAGGLDVTQDQYVYTASSTGLSQLIPDEALEGGAGRFAERLGDPAGKAAIVAGMRRILERSGRTNYAYAVIASCRHDPELNGLTVVEAARRRRGGDGLDDQIELILEIQRRGGATGVFHGIDEADLQTFLRHPNTMVASDSGLRVLGQGVPHPRGYGNTARVLGRYVRELKVLRLEDAVRKLTRLPAATFRLEGRGLLRPGAWADVVAFDPATVADTATFNDPHHYPEGIPLVLVNGVPVVRNGQPTDARPGRPLRRGHPRRGQSGRCRTARGFPRPGRRP